MARTKTKYELLTDYKFDDLSQMIRFLQNNGYRFKVDHETKKDIYVLEIGEYRNKSHHYEIKSETKGEHEFFYLDKIAD